MPRFNVTSYVTITLVCSTTVTAEDEDLAADKGQDQIDEMINSHDFGPGMDLDSIDDHNDTEAEED